MNQKKIAFTIGSINTFGNISSFSFNKEALDVRSRNTDATVPKSGLFQEHRQVAKV